jgi:hypothetical protein
MLWRGKQRLCYELIVVDIVYYKWIGVHYNYYDELLDVHARVFLMIFSGGRNELPDLHL